MNPELLYKYLLHFDLNSPQLQKQIKNENKNKMYDNTIIQHQKVLSQNSFYFM